jgi:peptidyl-prolyl cis-trans isomerase SurA
MKPLTSTLAALALLLAVASGRAEIASGITVIVHDSVITSYEVENFAGPGIEMAQRDFRNDRAGFERKLSGLLTNSMNQLIERRLIVQDFHDSGYNLPESLLEETVKDRIRERFGDRKTMTQTLKAQGITYEKFRQQIRDQIIVEALRAKNINSEVIISPHKIEKYYNEHSKDYQLEDRIKLRMIVLKKTAEDDLQARKLADEIEGKLKEGASFAEMAGLYSQGSQRTQGGDMGWVDRDFLRKDLADAAFALKPGERSPVIETKDGCYLLLVEEAKASHVRSLSEVRVEIENTLVLAERARLSTQYVDRLKKKTFIRYY